VSGRLDTNVRVVCFFGGDDDDDEDASISEFNSVLTIT